MESHADVLLCVVSFVSALELSYFDLVGDLALQIKKDKMNNKTRMEGLKALLSVLPAGSAEYKKLVKAMMAASGVLLGDNDYEDNEAEGTVE